MATKKKDEKTTFDTITIVFIKLVSIIVFYSVSLGFVIPWLMSSVSNIKVFLAIVGILAVIVVSFFFWKHMVVEYIINKFFKKEK